MLINQIAQNVLVALGDDFVGIGGVLLLRFLLQFLFAALVLRAGNNLIIDAGYNLLDYGVRVQKGRKANYTSQQQAGE